MLEYSPIKAEDLPVIKELYAQYLNSGESIGDLMDECWINGAYFGCTAKEDGVLLGFLTARTGIDFTYPKPELEAELAAFVQDKRLAMCDSLLVLPGHRKRGAAHELAKRVREQLKEEGFEYFLEEIWIYPDGSSPARPVLESMGRIVWQRRYDRFYQELEKYGMSCPLCGRDCKCGAWVEILAL